MDAVRKVTISQLKKDLERFFLIVPQVAVPFISGQPGIGKSAVVKQLAIEEAAAYKSKYCEGCTNGDGTPSAHKTGCRAAHDATFCAICDDALAGRFDVVNQETGEVRCEMPAHVRVIDIRLSNFDPIEIKGLPYTDESGTTRWACPEFLPRNKEEYSYLFLDEFRNACQAVQNSALQFVLDKRIHSFSLSPRCRVLAAGNTEDDGAFITRLSGPMNNRLAHFHVMLKVDDFVAWGQANGIRESITSAVQFDPDHLLPVFKKEQEAQPTPRTWEFFSRIWDRTKASRDEEIKSIAMPLIGTGATTNFMAFMHLYDAVKPDEIIEKGTMPKFDPDDKDISRRFATACAVANYMRRRADEGKLKKPEQINNFSKFLDCVTMELRIKTIKELGLSERPSLAALMMKNVGNEYKEIVNKMSKAMRA
jgi:hypothetical protein